MLLFKIAHWMCPSPRMQSSESPWLSTLVHPEKRTWNPKNHLSKKRKIIFQPSILGCPNVDFPGVKHHFLVSFFFKFWCIPYICSFRLHHFFCPNNLVNRCLRNAESTCDTDLTSATSVEVWTPVNGHVVE